MKFLDFFSSSLHLHTFPTTLALACSVKLPRSLVGTHRIVIEKKWLIHQHRLLVNVSFHGRLFDFRHANSFAAACLNRTRNAASRALCRPTLRQTRTFGWSIQRDRSLVGTANGVWGGERTWKMNKTRGSASENNLLTTIIKIYQSHTHMGRKRAWHHSLEVNGSRQIRHRRAKEFFDRQRWSLLCFLTARASSSWLFCQMKLGKAKRYEHKHMPRVDESQVWPANDDDLAKYLFM